MATSKRPTREKTDLTTQLQLPMWPDAIRGFPNAMARGALFTVANVRGGEREFLKNREIASLAGITINYSGEELRQDDEDVFLQLLHISRYRPAGDPVEFTAHSLLSELDWGRSSDGYRRLVECIDRLKLSALAITVEGTTGVRENFTGSLIRAFKWRDEVTKTQMREWQILLEPEIVALFGPTAYTRLDWAMRLTLSPMGKWLFSFYHTHQEPYPYKVDTLRTLMGSKIKELRMFRSKLRQTLEKLVQCGFLHSAHIDARTDMVVVQRYADSSRQAKLPRIDAE